MDALVTTSGGAAAIVGELSPDLFSDFISFIDRGERTTSTYLTNLRQFAAWLSYKAVKRPQRTDVVAYRDWLKAEHEAIKLDPDSPQGWAYRRDSRGKRYKVICKPSTVAQYLRSVKQFFKWTAAHGLYPDIAANIHAPRLQHGIHKKDALTASDVVTIEESIQAQSQAKITAAANKRKDTRGRIDRATEQGKRDLAIYTLAVNAGLRTVEISRANIGDLEKRGGQAVLYVWGKGHSEPDAKKHLAPEVYQIIKEYLNCRTDRPTAASPLFVATGNRSGGQRLASTTISKMLKRSMQAAGYDSERLTAHSLRHTTGTAVQELTSDIYSTQRYMRHSDPKTTQIYLHNDMEKQEAITAQQLYNYYHQF